MIFYVFSSSDVRVCIYLRSFLKGRYVCPAFLEGMYQCNVFVCLYVCVASYCVVQGKDAVSVSRYSILALQNNLVLLHYVIFSYANKKKQKNYSKLCVQPMTFLSI